MCFGETLVRLLGIMPFVSDTDARGINRISDNTGMLKSETKRGKQAYRYAFTLDLQNSPWQTSDTMTSSQHFQECFLALISGNGVTRSEVKGT